MSIELLLPKPRIIVPKPKSYVKLDMAFGVGAGNQLFDKSRYRSHGDINGPDWVAGLHGYCLDFVRASLDHVLIPAAHAQLDFTTEDFSIISRVYFDSLVGGVVLFTRGAILEDGYYMYVGADGLLQLVTSQLAAFQQSSAPAGSVATGAWYTVGFSRDGAAARLYANGVDLTTVFGVHINPLTSARSAKIGSHDDAASRLFDGRMEFLRIFGGVALTASEHRAWHRALA